MCIRKSVSKEQIDIFNRVNENLDGYMEDAESAFDSVLTRGKKGSAEKVKMTPLTFEIIEVPLPGNSRLII